MSDASNTTSCVINSYKPDDRLISVLLFKQQTAYVSVFVSVNFVFLAVRNIALWLMFCSISFLIDN